MKSEFFIDLCFIREQQEGSQFKKEIEATIKQLFTGKVNWSTELKRKENVDIVIVELNGIGKWQREEEIVQYLQASAPSLFLSWIQGYRIQVELKEDSGECLHCKKKEEIGV
ncbi:hypothetical protein [Bacillus horti]|uniref:Uncharacterized protein n=1 Tax=Caldalkalibacillus horti TaxID=77523 RepID=A0ABT9W2F8_9BACI|nr:hypothetical protein [Bacillus horti]MDQ0167426.1 hypothetical protein [Bacillus horti]